MNEQLFSPVIQAGFAGFCVLQFGIIVWLIRRLLAALESSNLIVAANTAAINTLDSRMVDSIALQREIHDKLLLRPCIAKGEGC